jgi:hypothetical protein
VKDAVQETNPCANAELVSASTKARNVHEVVFNGQMLEDNVPETVYIEIMDSLKTKFKDEAHENCPINYALKAFDPTSDKYVDWGKLVLNVLES